MPDNEWKIPASIIFLYPEPILDVQRIDGASFLYFPRIITATPSGPIADPSEWGLDVLDLITRRQPSWGRFFFYLWELWRQSIRSTAQVVDILSPVRDRLTIAHPIYSGDERALEHSAQLIRESSFSYQRIINDVATPAVAAGELMRHILLEKWLNEERNADAVFDYCDRILVPDRGMQILAEAYLLRCAPFEFKTDMTILLNNPGLVPFLASIPSGLGTLESDSTVPKDVLVWELFRQILSPFLDPITRPIADTIAECLQDRQGEVAAFKKKCERLADQLGQFTSLEELTSEAERFIELYVKDEIADLLRIRRQALGDAVRNVLADKGAWAATLAYIYGAVQGAPDISAAGAIGVLAFVGSSSARTVAEYRKNVKRSDYRLVYHLRH